MILPVVMRELRTQARLPSTHYLRVGVSAGLLIWSACFLIPVHRLIPAQATAIVQNFTLGTLLLLCLIAGIRCSVGTITEERVEGTLGLLFLTDLSGADVLFGKLAGAGLHAFLAILSTTPVLMLGVLLGGITLGEVVRSTLVLLASLLLAIGLGSAASVRAANTTRATVGVSALILGLLLFPPLLDLAWRSRGSSPALPLDHGILALPSPIVLLRLAGAAPYSGAPGDFWLGLGFQILLTAGLLGYASWRLSSVWRKEFDDTAGGGAGFRSAAKGARFDLRGVIDPIRAIEQLHVYRLSLRGWLIAIAGITLLTSLLQWGAAAAAAADRLPSLDSFLFVPMLFLRTMVSFLLCFLAARTVGPAVASGEMEILLGTAIRDRDVWWAAWRAMRRFVFMAVALNLVSAVLVAGFLRRVQAFNGQFHWALEELLYTLISMVTSAGVAAVSTTALILVSLWFAISRRGLLGAVAAAFAMVGVATPILTQALQMPLTAFIAPQQFPGSGYHGLWLSELIQALVYGLWIRWAMARLNSSFRAAATRAD